MLIKKMGRFLSFESVDLKMVLVTAFISYLLQINAIISGEPLYLIAFYTLLPWIPLLAFEGVWKIQNYAAVAFLGLFTILQLGHFGEHFIQVLQIDLWNGTVSCPPPLDNFENVSRAISNGLRDSQLDPTMYSVEQIIKSGPDGLPVLGLDGQPLIGPAACAVFGQLDLEIVHLVWELIGLFGTAGCLYFFSRNFFLWIAFACLCWHALEHLTITYFYYFDQEAIWSGYRQLWATYPDTGNSFIAHPIGKEPAMLNFYEAGGRFGLMAKYGMFEQLTGFTGMPGRAQLHMGYNLAITIPTVLGFLKEATVIRNKYLEQSFSKLSSKELSNLSLKVKNVKYKKGERVFSQGDTADRCFVITKGKADVILEQKKSSELYIATLGAGQIFGEIGLLDEKAKQRSATIVAKTALECLVIDKGTFADLMDSETGEFRSDDTKKELLKLANIRLDDIDKQGYLDGN